MGALFRQDFRVAIESPRLPREISIPFAPVAGAAMPWGKEPDERAFGCGAVLDDEGKPVFDKDGQLQLRCKEVAAAVAELLARGQVHPAEMLFFWAAHTPPEVALRELKTALGYQELPRGDCGMLGEYLKKLEDVRAKNPKASLQDMVLVMQRIETAVGTYFAVETFKTADFVPGAGARVVPNTTLVVVLLVALRGYQPGDTKKRGAATTKELGKILDYFCAIGALLPEHILVLEAFSLPGEDRVLVGCKRLDSGKVATSWNPRSALPNVAKAKSLHGTSARINATFLNAIPGKCAVVLSSGGAKTAWAGIKPLLLEQPALVTDCYHLSLSGQCKRYAERAMCAFAKAIKSLCYPAFVGAPGGAGVVVAAVDPRGAPGDGALDNAMDEDGDGGALQTGARGARGDCVLGPLDENEEARLLELGAEASDDDDAKVP